MSAYPDGGETVYDYSYNGRADATYEGDGEVYFINYKTTATGTNFVSPSVSTKWDDTDQVHWYSLELSAPPKEAPVQALHHVVPQWEREWVERVRVSEQRSVRDTRQAVWACRPRHGLGGG